MYITQGFFEYPFMVHFKNTHTTSFLALSDAGVIPSNWRISEGVALSVDSSEYFRVT